MPLYSFERSFVVKFAQHLAMERGLYTGIGLGFTVTFVLGLRSKPNAGIVTTSVAKMLTILN